MKISINNLFKNMSAILLCVVVLASCERDLSVDAKFADNSTTGEIFTDTFIGLGADFYFPYLDAKPAVFDVDNNEGFESSSSIRIDVPNSNDPDGAYAGAIFRVDGNGRNLTQFNALTFYAKATQGVVIDEIGFGEDFLGNKFIASALGFRFSTNWQKFIIPIPDPAKLVDERGLLRFAAGTLSTNGFGYTFWLDELKFENLGTMAQPTPAIFNGQDLKEDTFNGVSSQVTGLTQTFNLGNGVNQTVTAAPSYYTFTSSNTDVATVNELGNILVRSQGIAEITAVIGGVLAEGSLTVNSLGNFSAAPNPTVNAADVISIFSDSYTNVPVDFYNGFYAPFQTTTSNDFLVDGNNILNYQNFNFVGIEFNQNVSTIDASAKSKIHFDLFIPESLDSDISLRLNLVDFGPDASFGGNDDTSVSLALSTQSNPALVGNQWISVDMDISSLTRRNNLGQIIIDGTLPTPERPSAIYVDNIYIY